MRPATLVRTTGCYRPDMTTDTEPLRWGIAATGKIAASMCEALQTLPEARITAVGSRSLDSAVAFADRFGSLPLTAATTNCSPTTTSTSSTSPPRTATTMR